jgi:hypothetical protein
MKRPLFMETDRQGQALATVRNAGAETRKGREGSPLSACARGRLTRYSSELTGLTISPFFGIISSITNRRGIMGPTTIAKSLTVRLQPDLYEAATSLAKIRCLSLNALIQQSLEAAVQEAEDRQMYEDAELLGQYPEECEVEYAFPTQSEVVLREQP